MLGLVPGAAGCGRMEGVDTELRWHFQHEPCEVGFACSLNKHYYTTSNTTKLFSIVASVKFR